jgi:putative chitinase
MADAPKICGINAAIDEVKAGVDMLKEKLAAGVESIGDVGAIAQTIKNKLAEVNIPQVPSVNLQQELANLPNLSPDEYAAKVKDLKEKFGQAMTDAGQDLDAIINKIPKPAGLGLEGSKDIFAGLNALTDKVGAAFKNAQEQLSQLNIESIVGDICKDVPNIEVVVASETKVIVDPQNPQKEKTIDVPVVSAPEKKPTPPKTPSTNPAKEARAPEPPAKGFTFDFTQAKLIAAAGKNAGPWFDAMKTVLPKFNITTPERVAAFVGNCRNETQWVNLSENLKYKAEYLFNNMNGRKKIRFPTFEDAKAVERKEREIANIVYVVDRTKGEIGGEPEGPDHGWKYRGRGLLQLTFKPNYLACSKGLYGDDRLCQNPDIVATDKQVALETSCYYWKTNNLNEWCDKKAWGDVRAIVNSGRPLSAKNTPEKIHGYKEAVKYTEEAYAVFKG